MKKLLSKLFSILTLSFVLTVPVSRAATYSIFAIDNQFSPDTLNVLVGDTVNWVWVNGNHTITSNGVPPGAAPFNQLLDSFHISFTYVTTAPGIYYYISVPDLPSMQGKITASFPIGIFSPSLSNSNLKVFPTLVQDAFTVKFSQHIFAETMICLYNSSGEPLKVLLHKMISSGIYTEVFNLNEFYPPGVYFIGIQNKEGKMAQRIIVQ